MNELLAACIEAEKALAELERVLNKAVPGSYPLKVKALEMVRAAIKNHKEHHEN